MITSLLVAFTMSLQAQVKIPITGIDKATKIYPVTKPISIPCGGISNPHGIDLKWRPILTKKTTESENEGPNQNYIDSVKAYKLLLKQEYESRHQGNGDRTTTVLPVVGTNFLGHAPDGYQPLDNSVAISNGGIIVSVENNIIDYYNTSGTLLNEIGMVSLLSAYSPYSVCDPVVIYDPAYDRFIFFCQEINSAGLFNNNRIFICFSKSNNPNVGGWWTYELTGDPTGTGDGFDYPKLAINDSELFITGNLFTEPAGIFHQAVVFQLDKLAGYTGATLNGVNWTGISGSPFTILPVSWGQNGDLTTGMWMVSTLNGGGSTINEYTIVGNWCCSPSMYYSSVPTTPYTLSANALQLGTSCKLKTNDCRALSGFILDSTLHFVFHSDYGSGFTGINYNRLNVVTLTNTSVLGGALGYDFAYPSVASFATVPYDNSVMIGFGLSGSSIYPQICVINNDNAMSWSSYTTVHSSSTFIQYVSGDTLNRWGDYTGMSRLNSGTSPQVWMNGMFANTSNAWQTWIAQIYNSGTSTTCVTPTGLTATSITTTSALLNWGAASGAASYNIQYRQVGTTTWSNTTSTTTSVTITGLLASTNYEFQVQTVCSGTGTSSWSGSADFTTLRSTTGLNSLTEKQTKVYPNPITNNFSVEFSLQQSANLNISVVDINGQLVKQLYNDDCTAGENIFSFNKSNLASGIYFLVINANEINIKNEKIIVMDK